MYKNVKEALAAEIKEIKEAGLYKEERVITTPQNSAIHTTAGSEVLNFCANNYLGLSSHPEVLQAAKDTIDTHGFGMSSVRFICGTQNIHTELEKRIAKFLGTEDAILYAAAFDATLQGGLIDDKSVYTIPQNHIEPFTFQVNYGLVLQFGALHLEYSRAHITKEFSTGALANWGGVHVGFRI